MRARLEAVARRHWRGEGRSPARALAALLTPVEWAYGAAVNARNRRFDRSGGERLGGVRVVSVGNLVVGGTGKTPFTAWVTRYLSGRGAAPGVLLRGYGDDEPALHRRWNPEIPVVVDPDRVRGARAAQAAGARVVVLDDGFQHRRLARDLDIVLLAAEDDFPGRLLPRGPYREPAESLRRAHAVVVTSRTTNADAAPVLAALERSHPSLARAAVRLEAGSWLDLEGRPAAPPSAQPLVVSGIARPDAFHAAVAAATGGPVELMAFADHHPFGPADADRIARRALERPVVVTEKDAIKLARHSGRLGEVRVLTQTLRWECGERAVCALLDAMGKDGQR